MITLHWGQCIQNLQREGEDYLQRSPLQVVEKLLECQCFTMAFIMCVFTVVVAANKIKHVVPVDVDHMLDSVHACIF